MLRRLLWERCRWWHLPVLRLSTTSSGHWHVAMILRNWYGMNHDRASAIHGLHGLRMSMRHVGAHNGHAASSAAILTLRCSRHHVWKRLRHMWISRRRICHNLGRVWGRDWPHALWSARHGHPHRLTIKWGVPSIDLHPSLNGTGIHWMSIHNRPWKMAHHRGGICHIWLAHVSRGSRRVLIGRRCRCCYRGRTRDRSLG